MPKIEIEKSKETDKERRNVTMFVNDNVEIKRNCLVPITFSSRKSLLRIRALVTRFIVNSRRIRSQHYEGELSVDEIKEEENNVLRIDQAEQFKN
jgi:hypothetical protein